MLSTSYRADIQGLRALAVSSVIIFHFNKEWLPGGFIGVDIFLVISGFLITSIILNQKKQEAFSFRKFYLNRFIRIAPAYCALLMVVTIAMSILLTPQDFDFFYESLKHSLYFASNQYFSDFGNYFAPNSNELPLMHTWSLAVEMQFYMFLPLLLMFTPLKYINIIIVLLIFAISIYTSYETILRDNKHEMYFSLIARVPEFLIGSFCALNRIGKEWGEFNSNLYASAGLILIFLSFFIVNENSSFPGVLALPACLGTALIISSVHSKINEIFSSSILVWVGGISYSLYLWHWPILSGIRYYTENYILDLQWGVFFFSTTLGFAYISYRFVESHSYFKYKECRLIALLGLIGILVLVICLSHIINNKIVKIPDESLTRYAPSNEICHGHVINGCLRGSNSSNSKILVIGDSHAAQLNIAFDIIGKKNDLQFKIITASSCVTIPNFDIDRIPSWARNSCSEQIKLVKQLLPDYDNIILAGMWSYHTNSQYFMDALDSFLVDLDEKGMNVFVLSQIPMLKSNPIRLQRFNDLQLQTNTVLDKAWEESNNTIKEIVKNHKNAIFFDVSSFSIFRTVPFFNSTLIYMDNSHLNEVGSELYGEYLGKQLSKVIGNTSVM
ncbi:acyltransferase family protein [Aliivibrio fischeri]|uniref:acyltransferase family protein n=1 Tax=Aliivibrio fischeri TaxID=668 RepID=UPI0018C5F172|nr:acyltransferase family protein [Aliivibrio fischeri]